ncbi:PREDICTED: cytochrome c oxidase subunit 6a, mitochondrial-like isoform X1 [Nelumbo nucifera]|uniref:Cytochrome c oxidase subunit 6a, mitochondrial-like isoform X1 n=1 Tax=Nelumbo nucifera TaxID=4432 RepID=A0A1U7Z0U0_NELNU|nr:PREDICTED: cytochrome c oxidase subunit 6a, mitochondrial-like isoform X1 [Nelumbo nucifera]
MATAMMRSGLQAALRRGGRTVPPKRGFASSAHHDDAYETAKWEKITYAGIVTCTILSIYNLSKGHPHHEEPPPYSYLHIRNKEFPWGMVHSIHSSRSGWPF